MNFDYVSEVDRLVGGCGYVLLKTGERLEVSRRRARVLSGEVGGHLVGADVLAKVLEMKPAVDLPTY